MFRWSEKTEQTPLTGGVVFSNPGQFCDDLHDRVFQQQRKQLKGRVVYPTMQIRSGQCLLSKAFYALSALQNTQEPLMR